MTTKTNITLPPLPGALVDVETEARAYARAAVEADRKDHVCDATKMVPSDEEIVALSRQMLATARTDNMIAFARALLARYGRPAAPVAQEPVGEVFTMEPLDGSGDVRSHALLSKSLPAGTKLYAAQIAAQAQPSAQDQKCQTCGGRGWVGGPSYYAPDEGGEPCPDCAQDREDAERYRFIRPGDAMVWCSSGDDLLTGRQLDAAIDAARAAQGE
ncbi:hypothetical protein ACTPOE_16930 [Castellaniella sp. WN]